MATCLSIIVFSIVALAAGQTVQPSNLTLTPAETAAALVLRIGVTDLYNIVPLTSGAGLGQTPTAVNQVTYSGSLQFADPSSAANLTSSDIGYISCDPNSDVSNIDPSSVVATAASLAPKAIVIYSLTAETCNLTGSYNYPTILTMTSRGASVELLNTIQLAPRLLQANINANTTATIPSGSNTQGNNTGGPAPTTAVAMSILYTITGVITLLFLIIIATGAIRAHRHPERYGPRNGFPGRPRQSRAKGLARAMLETLPIVKFGDPEPVKPGSRDIELEDGNASVHSPPETVTKPVAAATSDLPPKPPTTAAQESGIGPNTQATSIASQDGASAREGELGCSICTEDFTTGEDVRVLPCQHKYHPACIDPWLLNVSGTCPLCRHDLRPTTSHTSDAAATSTEGDDLPPPLAETEGAADTAEAEGAADSTNPQRRRMTRFLDLHRLRHAPPDERIAALRRLRAESRQQHGEATDDVEERSRRVRLTGRLREAFRIRTRAQDSS